MSKYTTELRFICESLAGETESQEYSEVDDIIAEAAPKIFSFDFPLFDNNYRSELTKKIIRHYYTREIGFETYGLFKLKLEAKMNEIMPYYNQLYNSARLTLDPLKNYGFTKTSEGETTDTNETSNTSTTTNETATSNTTETEGEAWNKYSDTPQGAVAGLDSDNYLTNATKNTDTRSGSGTGTSDSETNFKSTQTSEGSGTNSYVENLVGYSGVSQSELLLKFRETFLNIDMMIIEELEELFFQLW